MNALIITSDTTTPHVVERGDVFYYVSDWVIAKPRIEKCTIEKASSKQVTLAGYASLIKSGPGHAQVGGYCRQMSAELFRSRCALTPERAVALAVVLKKQDAAHLRAQAANVDRVIDAIMALPTEDAS